MRGPWLCLLLVACTTESSGPLPDGGALPTDSGVNVDAGAIGNDPCSMSDGDGDGFGSHASCPAIDCDDGNAAIHPGAPEACNDRDDNCDGEKDEDLGEGSCGLGACRVTMPFCAAGRPAACVPGTPGVESCNNIDDDCDGVIDNGVGSASCGVGACIRQASCVGGGVGPCTPGDPVPESCNRSDDNCDGTNDEGFRVTVWNGTYTRLHDFESRCDGNGERMGLWCNSAMHRYCAQDGCTTSGFGPLENSGDTSFVACVAAEPSITLGFAELATHQPPCDGAIERIGPNCNAAIHRYCAAHGYATGFGPVENTASEATITCLRAGAASVINTTYTVLATFHDGCTTATRIGPACNAAINRYCNNQGHSTGYGPVENFDDNATVVCVDP